jgi:hypothetical protein
VDRWVSLCEIRSWIEAASTGDSPFDGRGHAGNHGATEAQGEPVVFCKGSPASDPIRSLKGIRTDQPWNHRLLAAYRDTEKFVLDLDTGQVVHWPRADDSDGASPAPLSPSAGTRVREEIFGPYESREAARLAGGSAAEAPIDVEIDERLRSWGYD